MRIILGLAAVFAAATALAIAFAGTFSVSAREPHWKPVTSALEWMRNSSIRAQSGHIKVPENYGGSELLREGIIHVEAHCRICHGAPGEGPGELGKGMYPQPADLAQSAQRHSPAELFWIIQNGIKMTGMPSWAGHGDDELWSVVALLERLPSMTKAEYASLAAATAAAGQTAPAASAPHAGHHNHSNHRH